jgi:CxxC-x17-CxxC domain-containing protein
MQKTMFEIKCSECGKTALVPFKPAEGKAAYCKTCFSKRRFAHSENIDKTSGFNPKQAWTRRKKHMQVNKVIDNPAMF